ncbi:MAG: C10 family peptidase [Bacteroidaceae bacterium]|nr:C10 family peptidase [Bacteroidaceae bacterium]
MRKNIFFIASAILLLAACNNNDEALTSFNDDNPKVSNEFALSNDEAKDLLSFFVNDGASTRSDGKSVTVKDYKVRNIEVTTEDDTEIVPVYAYTTMNENGEEGYSIVIGDRRIQKVLVQVDKGSLADTTDIPPLKWFINSIPNIIENDLLRYNVSQKEKPISGGTRDSYVETHYCFLPTYWDQGSPYNEQCPPCSSGGHCVVGCVPLAMGQILAYHHIPSSLNWSSILQSYQVTSNSSATVKSQVANLLATLGSLVHVNYGCSSSGVSYSDMWRVANTFRNTYSMSCGNLVSFDLDSIISSLGNNRPVFLMGYATVGGHAWVCDAWKRHHYDNNEYYDYLNMNWGWGGSSNGFYYIDSPMSFNTGSYTFYYGFEMITNIRP